MDYAYDHEDYDIADKHNLVDINVVDVYTVLFYNLQEHNGNLNYVLLYISMS